MFAGVGGLDTAAIVRLDANSIDNAAYASINSARRSTTESTAGRVATSDSKEFIETSRQAENKCWMDSSDMWSRYGGNGMTG